MLNVSQIAAILPLAAQAAIDEFSRAEAPILSRAASGAPERVPARAASEPAPLYALDAETGTAVIPLRGTVISRRTPCMAKYPELFNVCACDELRAAISAALKDDKVKCVALDVDSPGGTVTGVPEVAGTIASARAVKPVVAFSGGMCCSAAYWIAAQASAFFVSPSATTGSIGVFMAFIDTSRKLAAEGYKVELFTTGKYKGAGVTGELTDAQRERFQAQVERVFADFKAALAHRGLDEALMQGQTFYGADAAALRLADGLALDVAQAARIFGSLTA